MKILITTLLILLISCTNVRCQSSPSDLETSARKSNGNPLIVRHDAVQQIAYGTTPPLRELAKHYPSLRLPDFLQENELSSPPIRQSFMRSDAVLQTQTSNNLTASLGLSFDGLGDGAFAPDTNGAVGTTQYVLVTNWQMTVFDKTTGGIELGYPVETNALWAALGDECSDVNEGDATIAFDKLAQRWVLQQFALGADDETTGGPYYDCVAVSTSDDATGSWNAYQFGFNFGSSYFPDYPKLGTWPVAYPGLPEGVYLLSFNIFNGGPPSGTYNGPDACFLDRGAMLAGTAATSNECYGFSSAFNSFLPSDLDGYIPPSANEPAFFMTWDPNGASVDLITFVPCYPNCSEASGINVSAPAFTPYSAIAGHGTNCGGRDLPGECDIPEASGDGTYLDSLSSYYPMYRLAYRNFGTYESLVFNHTVLAYFDQTNEVAGVRWYEIQDPSGTPVVAQAGTWSPGGYEWRWMGSTSMDSAGDQALGYSVSLGQLNGSPAPQIAITGRTVNDPQNTMEGEVIVAQSLGYQNGGDTRWGDYSSMQIDPADDCTFWYTQEYLPNPGYGTGTWVPHIATFKFPNCVSDFSLSPAPSSSNVTPGNSAQFTVTIVPQGAFGSSISFTCSGLPSLSSCTFSPGMATPFASSATTQLTITTTGPTTSLTLPTPGNWSNLFRDTGFIFPAILICYVGLAKPKRVKKMGHFGVLILAGSFLFQIACGNGGNNSGSTGGGSSGTSGTPAGTYTVTVMGSTGSTQHTTTVSLTVQ
jgi:hypothetical protein